MELSQNESLYPATRQRRNIARYKEEVQLNRVRTRKQDNEDEFAEVGVNVERIITECTFEHARDDTYSQRASRNSQNSRRSDFLIKQGQFPKHSQF